MLTSDLMVCSVSSSETVHYAHKRNTQEAWIEFDIASISAVLYYAMLAPLTHASRGERFADQNYATAMKFKANIRAYNLALISTSKYRIDSLI